VAKLFTKLWFSLQAPYCTPRVFTGESVCRRCICPPCWLQHTCRGQQYHCLVPSSNKLNSKPKRLLGLV